MISQSISCVAVKTADSDVVVILISFMKQLLDKNTSLTLYVDFASGENRRYISINSAYDDLDKMFSTRFLFFIHSLNQTQQMHSIIFPRLHGIKS